MVDETQAAAATAATPAKKTKKRKVYTAAFKAKAVSAAQGGKSKRQVCKDAGISALTLDRWIKASGAAAQESQTHDRCESEAAKQDGADPATVTPDIGMSVASHSLDALFTLANLTLPPARVVVVRALLDAAYNELRMAGSKQG